MEQCSLCGNAAPLINGHTIPAWAFRRVYDQGTKAFVRFDGRAAHFDNDQLKARMLCEGCEDRIAEAERYAARMAIQPDDSFPALARSRVLPIFDAGPTRFIAVGLDTRLLSYFAASVFWRAHGSGRFNVDLDGAAGVLRRYLRHGPFASFPSCLHLTMSVLDPPNPIYARVMTAPCSDSDRGFRRCTTIIGGFRFSLVGDQSPRAQRTLSLSHHRVYLVDQDEQTQSNILRLYGGSELKGRLALDHA